MAWNKRKSTRCLWSTLVITTFVVCVVFAFISFSFGNKYGLITRRSTDYSPISERLTEEECNSICDSKDCVQQSKMLLDHVQPAFDPCDNFYKFSCGKFLESSSPSDFNNFVTRYTSQMRIKLRNILDNLKAGPDSASGKMKIVYDSCMKPGSDSQAVPEMLQILDNFGIQNWPNLTPDFKFGDFGLAKVIANLLLYDEYGFVKITRKGSSNIQANLSLAIGESSYDEKEKSIRNFQVYRILNYFQFDAENINTILEESEAIYDAVKHLIQESESISEEDESEILVDCYGGAENDWKDLCETLDLFINIADVGEEANKNYVTIYASDVYFMQNIFPLIRNFTDRSTAHYLTLNILLNHLDDLNFSLRLIQQKEQSVSAVLEGKMIPINRWEQCVDWISNYMTFALAYEFIQKDVTKPRLKEVLNLTEEVIHETAETFSQQKWISENVLKDITERIRNIEINLQFLLMLAKKSIMNNFYKEFQPEDGSFLKSIMKFRKYARVEEMRGKRTLLLKRSIRFSENFFLPGASGGGGMLAINLGILLPPTYSPGLQRLFNIVTLGMILAHEIGHNIFEYQNLQRLGAEANDYFQAKRKCIEDQVSQFQFELIGKNLNGSQYSREDIADNVAVPIIEKMIERYLSKGEEISLPALPYSTKQLLYISAALTWCSANTKESEEYEYEKGSHSPTNARVFAMMQNSKGFSEAFDCPEGSFMNPADKCLIFE